MANNNETTMRYNADISGLKKGLADANRQIRLANAQFSAASSAMDNWSSSADGLTAKISQLEAVQDAENKKLQLLQQQYDLTAAAMGENSTEAQELLIQINRQQTNINRVNSELNNYRSQLDQVANTTDDAGDAAENNVSAYDRLSNTITDQEAELKRLQDEYKNYVVEGNGASEEARRLAGEISDLSGDLDANRTALNNADSAADNLAGSMDDAGGSTETLSDGFTVLKGAIADLVADGIKWCIDSLKDLMTASDEAFNTFQTKTGTSTEAMAEFEDQISELYKNNYGESLNDVADAMAEVAQTSKETDPSKIQELTKNAIILRDTFGFEINETMRAANMLMDQFGMTGDEAFNLIAQGAQNGLNKNGDLLDSINEYSVHYKQLGFTGEEFFNSLENGAAAGTFSVDKLGDAMKEFGIRAKDTATSTDEAYAMLNMDADEMRARFAAGGESAQQAMGDVLTTLFSMDDAVTQNQAGVNLFGTMWEDLGIDGVKALTDIIGSADATKNTLEDIDAIKYNDLGNAFEEIKRIISVDLLQPIVDELEPSIKSFVEWLKGDAIPWIIENGDKIIAVITGIGTAFLAFKAVTIIQSVISAFSLLIGVIKSVGIAQTALNVIMAMNPVGLIVAAIAGLVAAFVVLWNKSEAFRNFWITLWDNIVETVKKMIGYVVDFWSGLWDTIKEKAKAAGEFIKTIFTAIGDFFAGVWTSISDAAGAAWDAIKAFFAPAIEFFVETWNAISNAASAAWEAIKNYFAPAVEWFSALFESIRASVESVITVIVGLAKGCWNIIQRVFEVVGEWFNKNVITPVEKFFTDMWKKISDAAKAAWDAIVAVFKVVANWYYKNVIEPTLKFYKMLWDGIKTGASVAWEAIKTTFKVVSKWFNDTVVTPVTKFFGDMWGKVKTGASDAWDGITSVFGSVADWFREKFSAAWQAVKDVFSTGGKIFDGIKDGIVSAFKTVVNGIIGGINKILTIPFNKINEMLNKIRNTEVLGIKPFDGLWKENPLAVPQIPELAKGGVLKRGQVGLLEGNGAEAVVPLEKNTQWIKRVAAEMSQQLCGGTAGSSCTNNTVNNYTFNQTNNSPKALNRLEIYRQSKQQTAFIKAVTSGV